jgi:Flp pilus assembly protein TadG
MICGVWRDLRGVIALFTALMLPSFIILLALVVDAGLWLVNSARLQIAADSAAMVAGTMMLTAAYQGQTSAVQITNAINVAAVGAQLGANQLTGTITPSVTIDGPNYTTATVNLTMPAFTIFASALGVAAPTLRAAATATIAPKSCVLALAPSGTGISVTSGGTLTTTNVSANAGASPPVPNSCPIFSDASDGANASSIVENSGTIRGYTVGAVGTVSQSGGTIVPSTTSSGRPAQLDYLAGTISLPYAQASPPPCTFNNQTIAGSITTSVASPTTFCGQNTAYTGTITFGPGVYYIYSSAPNQGSLVFNGTTVGFPTGAAGGATFVLLGPGLLWFYNGATTSTPLVAPPSGQTAGLAVIGASTTVSATLGLVVQSNAAVTMSGTIYLPSSAVRVDANSTLGAPSGSPLNIVANTVTVSGSGSTLSAAGTFTPLATPVLVD